ncbi:MAG: hypothetical protein ACTSRG_19565 [Candidatus Helarchaeota archaeon]
MNKNTVKIPENLKEILDIPQDYFVDDELNLDKVKWGKSSKKVDRIIAKAMRSFVTKLEEAKNKCLKLIRSVEKLLANFPLSLNEGEILDQYRRLYEEINVKLLTPLETGEDLYEIIKPFEEKEDNLSEFEMRLFKTDFYSVNTYRLYHLDEALQLYKEAHENLFNKIVKLHGRDKVRKQEINYLLIEGLKLFDENEDTLDRCACVLARIALERTLKILCDENLIPSNQQASRLNEALWNADVYAKGIWREISYLLDIGNAAAHSRSDWEKYSLEEKKKMVRDVENFINRYG